MSHHPDVLSTLDDLEHQLRDLERELAATSSGASLAVPVAKPAGVSRPGPHPDRLERPSEHGRDGPTSAPTPPAPAPQVTDAAAHRLIAEAKASLNGLHHQLDDLVRVRQELERSTRELMEEYARVLSTFGEAAEPGALAPPTAVLPCAAPSSWADLTPVAPGPTAMTTP
jgi:hypothetical protein